MLYDNAQLIDLYALMANETGSSLARSAAEGIVSWLTREMLTPEGAFASSLDADSEGEEGKFYVWEVAELQTVLGPEDATLFARFYDVSDGGNRQQHLLPILAHAQHHEKRDRGRLAVEPDAHNGAVEDEADDRLGRQVASGPGAPTRLPLAPPPADAVLAARPAEERGQRPPDPARVRAGQIGARDQRLGSARQALVGRE